MLKCEIASKNSLLNINIIDASTAITTTKATMILIGKPTTKRLNEGIVFINMPKTISANKDNPTIGKDKINPITNKLVTAPSKYVHIFILG